MILAIKFSKRIIFVRCVWGLLCFLPEDAVGEFHHYEFVEWANHMELRVKPKSLHQLL